MVICTSIKEVRHHIDHIDRDLVALLARRGNLVNQAAAFKKTTAEVKAPLRVVDVIAKVRVIANECGGSPEVVEKVYRTMIAAFIEEELAAHAALKTASRPNRPCRQITLQLNPDEALEDRYNSAGC